MKHNINALVQRQAAILAEIDHMEKAELESLANSRLSEGARPSTDEKARRLLRGLIRTQNVGKSAISIDSWTSDKSAIIPALPDYVVIDLMPLLDGGFDVKNVLKTPVVAWKIDPSGDVEPIIPGAAIGDRWAVLTPDGYVVTDKYTNLLGELPLPLEEWIRSEIARVEDRENCAPDFCTLSQKVFQHSGPLPRAIWFMMADRHYWAGTPVEMLGTLSKFRDHSFATGWPSDPTALAAALVEVEAKLADIGLIVARIDDGRLLVTRMADETAEGGSVPPA